MRLGEICGLQWGDIDFEGRFIEVRRSLVDGARIELPKNGKIRCVDPLLILADTLHALRARRGEEKLAKDGRPHLSGLRQRGGSADLEVRL